MKYIPVHCSICNTDFDLVEDEYGYTGVCNCEEIPEDLELEDTIIERKNQKQRIKDYFKEHDNEVLGYGDIAYGLQMSLAVVVELCDELENEGIIGMASDSLLEKRRSQSK